MKYFANVIVAALLLRGGSIGLFVAAAEPQKPNIVLIMADDLGFSDLGCYGSEIRTPHLDRLAADGLRFTQFYNMSRCCPTRAALLTGLYPHQVGVGHMEKDLGAPAYRGYLNQRCVTIAEALTPHGYRCCIAGKWNVGFAREQWPLDRGFTKFFGLLRGASDYFDPRVGPRRGASLFGLEDQPFTDFAEDFYATDTFTDYAVRFIDESSKAGPFFLYVPYTAPHSPLQARPRDIAKYRDQYRAGWDVLRERRRTKMIEQGIIDAKVSLSPRDARVPAWNETSESDQDLWDLKMAVYAAQVDALDQGVGRIMTALRQANVLKSTLVLFLSDNGADGEAERSTPDIPPGPKASSHIYGRAWAQLSNTPFRGYKHEAHEGGIATPLIASWPATIQPGGITHEPGHVIDLMATCLDVAGVEYPRTFKGQEILPLEGRSLLPVFRTLKRQPHDALFWEHEGNRAVRRGPWKLVALHGRPWQLFDLSQDRSEQHDQAAEHPPMVRELTSAYEAWAERVGVLPWKQPLVGK